MLASAFEVYKQPKFAAECRGPYASATSAGIKENTAP